MTNIQTVKFEPLRSLAFGSISGTYAAIGTPLDNPARLICITNATNGNLLLSINGSTDILFLYASTFKLFDLNTNRTHASQYYVLPVGTQFYVKQSTAPTSGEIYIEALY